MSQMPYYFVAAQGRDQLVLPLSHLPGTGLAVLSKANVVFLFGGFSLLKGHLLNRDLSWLLCIRTLDSVADRGSMHTQWWTTDRGLY